MKVNYTDLYNSWDKQCTLTYTQLGWILRMCWGIDNTQKILFVLNHQIQNFSDRKQFSSYLGLRMGGKLIDKIYKIIYWNDGNILYLDLW